jgi:hypothetical protein
MHASGPPQPSLRRARELLGVAADANAAQLARAFRRQARRLHPDISVESDATEQFWTLQAAYRVALEGIKTHAPQTAAQVVHHLPTVVIGAATSGGVPATARRERRGVAWLVAGPVRVQPLQRPNPAITTSSSEAGP